MKNKIISILIIIVIIFGCKGCLSEENEKNISPTSEQNTRLVEENDPTNATEKTYKVEDYVSVFMDETFIHNQTGEEAVFRIPKIINLDSDYVNELNEIFEEISEEGIVPPNSGYSVTRDFEAYINENVLVIETVSITGVFTGTPYYEVYTVNLLTGEEISNSYYIDKLNIEEVELKKVIEQSVDDYYYATEKNEFCDYTYIDNSIRTALYGENYDKAKLYIDSKGEPMLSTVIYHSTQVDAVNSLVPLILNENELSQDVLKPYAYNKEDFYNFINSQPEMTMIEDEFLGVECDKDTIDELARVIGNYRLIPEDERGEYTIGYDLYYFELNEVTGIYVQAHKDTGVVLDILIKER